MSFIRLYHQTRSQAGSGACGKSPLPSITNSKLVGMSTTNGQFPLTLQLPQSCLVEGRIFPFLTQNSTILTTCPGEIFNSLAIRLMEIPSCEFSKYFNTCRSGVIVIALRVKWIIVFQPGRPRRQHSRLISGCKQFETTSIELQIPDAWQIQLKHRAHIRAQKR